METEDGQQLPDLPRSLLVPLTPGGDCPPLICFPSSYGMAFAYHAMAAAMPADVPLVAVDLVADDVPRLRPDLIELADRYARLLMRDCPARPLLLAGYCLGGQLAYETARRLTELGEQVALVALLGSYTTRDRPPTTDPVRLETLLRQDLDNHFPGIGRPELESIYRVASLLTVANHDYELRRYSGRVLFVEELAFDPDDLDFLQHQLQQGRLFGEYVDGPYEVVPTLQGSGLLLPPQAGVVAAIVAAGVRKAMRAAVG